MCRLKILLSICFVLGLVPVIFGQTAPPTPSTATPPPGAGDRDLADKKIKSRSVEIDRMKMEAKKRAARDPQAIFLEIKEDFEQIQIVNTEKIQRKAVGENYDYVSISAGAAEIEKRGTRLHGNLFAQKKKKKKKKTSVDEVSEEKSDLKSKILELDNLVYRFTKNPIFTAPKVNKKEKKRADQELTSIIKLSKEINEKAVAMIKP